MRPKRRIDLILSGLAAAAFVLLALLVAACYWMAGLVMYPPANTEAQAETHPGFTKPIGNPKADLGLGYQEVSFETEDGLTIRAWYVPAASASVRSIIAVHGGRNDRRSFMPFLESWHRAGMNVLLIDARGHGTSDDDGFGLTLGLRESRDVRAAASWLREARSAERVGAIGVSQGASAVLLASAGGAEIDAVVVSSVGYDLARLFSLAVPGLPAPFRSMAARMLLWRTGVPLPDALTLSYPQLEAARQLQQPILFIHGSEDPVIHLDTARHLFDQVPATKHLWVIEGLKHELPIAREPEESLRRVTLFFDRNL